MKDCVYYYRDGQRFFYTSCSSEQEAKKLADELNKQYSEIKFANEESGAPLELVHV